MRDDETFRSENAISPKDLDGPLSEVFPDGHSIRHSLLLKDGPAPPVAQARAEVLQPQPR